MADLNEMPPSLDTLLCVVVRQYQEGLPDGNGLARLRRNLMDISQADLGELLGYSRNFISRAERNPNPDPALCYAYLGRSLVALFNKESDRAQ